MEEKFFQLSTYSESQWDALNLELGSVGSLSNAVPQRVVACVDEMIHSDTRGTYLLTQDEADALKNDPRVKWISPDYKRYPEYHIDPKDVHCTVPTISRWTSSPLAFRAWDTEKNQNEVNRMGYGVVRHREFAEYWKQNNLLTYSPVPTNVSGVYGTGKHVDVIVADDGGGWHGHPEFYNDPKRKSGNSAVEKPNGYAGGNRLPGNGKCDVLDLVLDAPYYLDPDWFNASPGTRLITRWDGTRVPVEGVAMAWWRDASQRSPAFASAGVISGLPEYTRANNNGTNTVKPPWYNGQHATPCMALAYGRTQGWAYNSNKWSFNLINQGLSFYDDGFNIVKIFHKNKPINPLYGNKDPTIMSNSWCFRTAEKGATQYVPQYYTHRSTANVKYESINVNVWINQLGRPNYGGDGRWTSEMKPNALTESLDELIAAGVIFVAAAGNDCQKQVLSDHPDYNNYITKTDGGSLVDSQFDDFGFPHYGTTNRRGFPNHGGAYVDGSGNRVYPVISIGALDVFFRNGKESKVHYSNRGNAVDAYFSADLVLAADHSYNRPGASLARADTYTGLTVAARDTLFDGTSAACPGATGFIACVLEYNRTWGWQDVKNWIAATNPQDPGDFHYGVESTTVTDPNWRDNEGLEGGLPRVLYQLPEYYNDNLGGGGTPTPSYSFGSIPSSINEGSAGTFNVTTTNVANGTTLYWTVSHGTTTDADFVSTSGSVTTTNDRGLFDVNTTADNTTEGTQNFQIQLRLDSTSGTVIGTSGTVSIGDTSVGEGGASYALSGFAGIINEGDKTTVVVTTTNVPNGTTLYWAINHVSTTAADFTAQSGSFTVNSNTGSFVINTKVT